MIGKDFQRRRAQNLTNGNVERTAYFWRNVVRCRTIPIMTKISAPIRSRQHWQTGFRQLLNESGVSHVDGMEILRLVKTCAGAYDRVLGERMRDEEISLAQWRILIRLYQAERNEQHTLSPTELAHRLCLSRNTISAHLRTLEEARLIERQLDPSDLRAFRIGLTDESRSLIRVSTPLHIEFLNELVAQLSTEESEMLQGLLSKLLESLQRKREDAAAS